MTEVAGGKIVHDTLGREEDSMQVLSAIEYRAGQTQGKESIAIIPLLIGLKHGISLGPNSRNMAESFEEENRSGVIGRIEDFLSTIEMSPLSESFLILPPREGEPQLRNVTQQDVDGAKKRPMDREDIETDIRASAIFTDIEGVPLLCKPADCPVVILIGKGVNGKSVLGLVHAGRAETNLQIPKFSVEHMRDRYGCAPSGIRVGIGPSISKNNYFIKEADARIIDGHSWQDFSKKRFVAGENRLYLDILGNITNQLIYSGLIPSNIQAYGSGVDTFELAGKNPPEAFSQRYSNATDNTSKNGRILVAAQL